jgi:hypothetical protein
MRITVIDTRVHKGNQRATEGDVEKIAITAKTGDLATMQETENAR